MVVKTSNTTLKFINAEADYAARTKTNTDDQATVSEPIVLGFKVGLASGGKREVEVLAKNEDGEFKKVIAVSLKDNSVSTDKNDFYLSFAHKDDYKTRYLYGSTNLRVINSMQTSTSHH